MKNLALKNKKRTYLYQIVENRKNVLDSIFINFALSKKLRAKSFFILKTLPRNGSITRLNNRCLLTNRSRAVYRKFKLSRLCFRDLANNGRLVGIRKSNW